MIDLDEDIVPAKSDAPGERRGERITLLIATILTIAIIAASIWDFSTAVAESSRLDQTATIMSA